ncbi:hypothetical protein DSM3645_25557 [Blastopirellula marina DSM 3645]|uniref:Uncharacterized protein n=1 Tax=Blastopirellula marina DSM 3645 TaxID=314230 RepID=A4A0H9_9BACT|nr:hypothetical protein DSM3645_25557 [Blastopirellula marina DSM 3645]
MGEARAVRVGLRKALQLPSDWGAVVNLVIVKKGGICYLSRWKVFPLLDFSLDEEAAKG